MNTEMIEAIAAKVHEAWMVTKREQGVTSRPSEWGEEQMVPYADLSERAKDLDRSTVLAVLPVAVPFMLAEKDAEIERLREALDWWKREYNNKATGLTETIAERDAALAEIERLRTELDTPSAAITQLRQAAERRTAERDAALAALDFQTALLEDARSALESTKDRMDDHAYDELSCPLSDGALDELGATYISERDAALARLAKVEALCVQAEADEGLVIWPGHHKYQTVEVGILRAAADGIDLYQDGDPRAAELAKDCSENEHDCTGSFEYGACSDGDETVACACSCHGAALAEGGGDLAGRGEDATKPSAELADAFAEGVAAERANHKRIKEYHHWSDISSTAPPPSPPNPYLTEGGGE